MMAALFPVFAFFMLFFPMSESLIIMAHRADELSALDQELGDAAEELCTLINTALAMNLALQAFQAECPIALATYTVPALQAAAQGVRLEQEALLLAAGLDIQRFSYFKYDKELNTPTREPPGGPCSLPGALSCFEKKIFSIQYSDGSKPAGILAETPQAGSACQRVEWKYSDERVRPLK